MSAVMVDSNVLLDVMSEDTRWFSWASQTIERTADRYRLVMTSLSEHMRRLRTINC
jgi:predicted nucleic acid-binding protein